MAGSLVNDPNELTEGGIGLDHGIERKRAGGSNNGINGRTTEHGDKLRLGDVKWYDDSRQVRVERACKEGYEQFDRVGEIDCDFDGALFFDVSADDIDLSIDVGLLMLAVFLAAPSHTLLCSPT